MSVDAELEGRERESERERDRFATLDISAAEKKTSLQDGGSHTVDSK